MQYPGSGHSLPARYSLSVFGLDAVASENAERCEVWFLSTPSPLGRSWSDDLNNITSEAQSRRKVKRPARDILGVLDLAGMAIIREERRH